MTSVCVRVSNIYLRMFTIVYAFGIPVGTLCVHLDPFIFVACMDASCVCILFVCFHTFKLYMCMYLCTSMYFHVYVCMYVCFCALVYICVAQIIYVHAVCVSSFACNCSRRDTHAMIFARRVRARNFCPFGDQKMNSCMFQLETRPHGRSDWMYAVCCLICEYRGEQ